MDYFCTNETDPLSDRCVNGISSSILYFEAKNCTNNCEYYEITCFNGYQNIENGLQNWSMCYCNTHLAIDIYNNSDLYIGIVMLFFGIIGALVSLITSLLILCKKDLRTSYGVICCVEAIADFILLLEIGLIEGTTSLDSGLTFINIRSDTGDPNPIYWLYYYVYFWIQTNDTNLDLKRTVGARIIAYINFTTKTISILMRALKAFNRVVALYLPIFYMQKFSPRFTLFPCFVIIVITMGIYLPMLGLGFEGCVIVYARAKYVYNVGCGSVYHIGQPYFELVIAMLCTGLDIATLIKFRKLATNGGQRRREKIMLIQNWSNLIVFVASLVPNLIYTLIGYHDDACGGRFALYLTFVLLVAIEDTSVKSCVGHAIDVTITLILQIRLAKILAKQNSINSLQVQPINQ